MIEKWCFSVQCLLSLIDMNSTGSMFGSLLFLLHRFIDVCSSDGKGNLLSETGFPSSFYFRFLFHAGSSRYVHKKLSWKQWLTLHKPDSACFFRSAEPNSTRAGSVRSYMFCNAALVGSGMIEKLAVPLGAGSGFDYFPRWTLHVHPEPSVRLWFYVWANRITVTCGGAEGAKYTLPGRKENTNLCLSNEESSLREDTSYLSDLFIFIWNLFYGLTLYICRPVVQNQNKHHCSFLSVFLEVCWCSDVKCTAAVRSCSCWVSVFWKSTPTNFKTLLQIQLKYLTILQLYPAAYKDGRHINTYSVDKTKVSNSKVPLVNWQMSLRFWRMSRSDSKVSLRNWLVSMRYW